jgi:signal transduction histidine kinase
MKFEKNDSSRICDGSHRISAISMNRTRKEIAAIRSGRTRQILQRSPLAGHTLGLLFSGVQRVVMDDRSAEQALAGALQQLGGKSGALFEQSDPGAPFILTASTDALSPTANFAADSLLPRWLRVNNLALPVPDAIGVFDRLTPTEIDMLQRLGATRVAPLLTDRHMAGWLAVTGDGLPSSAPQPVPPGLEGLAADLLAGRLRAKDQARGEVVARSNRLSLTGQIAAGVAHEVRNPLAAVRTIVQMVQHESREHREHTEMLGTVVNEIDRVTHVLTGMLRLGRPGVGRNEWIDLTALVQDAVGFCQSYAKAHRQQIVFEATNSVVIAGDPHELRQVLVNVLLNASQASGPGQDILVDIAADPATPTGPTAVVRVVDQGVGIPKEALARVFDPFFSTKVDGGGLGLSLCRDAMRRHRGEIAITSCVGEGTVVSLTFVLADTDG